MSKSTFKGIKAGDRVRFRLYSGSKLLWGKSVPEYKVRTATVNSLLLFEHHVVVNLGPFGQVVNAENYLGHSSPK